MDGKEATKIALKAFAGIYGGDMIRVNKNLVDQFDREDIKKILLKAFMIEEKLRLEDADLASDIRFHILRSTISYESPHVETEQSDIFEIENHLKNGFINCNYDYEDQISWCRRMATTFVRIRTEVEELK